jgi:diguanylate cyclase (GGDEF)-like protein/PAS domain S-box-containing protein
MITTERQDPPGSLPDAANTTLGFVDQPPRAERSSWKALAAVYAVVPMAIVGFWWLYREHHLGNTPMWALIAILAVTSVANLLSFVWLRQHPGPGTRMQVRLAVSAFSTAAVVYAAGWGSIFVVGYAVGVAEIVRSNGSATWRGALGWNAGAILTGEIAIQLHLAPSILPVPVAHDVALLGFCCLAVVTRVLVLTGQSVEAAEAQLRERSHHFETLVAHASDVIGVVDKAGSIRFASPAVETLLGYTPAELCGAPLASVIDPADVDTVRQVLDNLPTGLGSIDRRDVRFRHRNGHELRVVMTFTSSDASGAGSVVINLHNVTVERELEDRLRFDAMHDPLTGTWNRAAFTEAMEIACAAGARDGGMMALLFVDIDGFKQINDTLGHDRGDETLTNVARSIQSCLRGGDILGRWGGDEFVVLLNHAHDPDEPVIVADRILTELERASAEGPRSARTTVSIGIATSIDGALSAPTLARLADEAMYSAKRDGRARWALSPASPEGRAGGGPHQPASRAI